MLVVHDADPVDDQDVDQSREQEDWDKAQTAAFQSRVALYPEASRGCEQIKLAEEFLYKAFHIALLLYVLFKYLIISYILFVGRMFGVS